MKYMKVFLIQYLLMPFIRGNKHISLERYYYRSHINGKSCPLSSQVFWATEVTSAIGCTSKCTALSRCNGVFYNVEKSSCEGCVDRYNETSGLIDKDGTKYYSASSKAWQTTTYNFTHTSMNFQDAVVLCKADGGYLLQVDSEEENQYIADNFEEGERAVWLGLTDEVEEGVFRWVTYESQTGYTNWRSGVLDQIMLDYNCAIINPLANFAWGDRDCNANYVTVVCEYDTWH